jgi:hypothetical protein
VNALLVRAGPWRGQLGLVAAGTLLGLTGLLLSGASGARAGQLACLLVGVAACYALDEPAAEVVDACAVSLRRRTAVRVLALVLSLTPAAALWALTGATRLLLLQLGGTALLGVGAAGLVRRWAAEPGELVAPALLLVGLSLLLVDQVGARIPLYPLGPAGEGTYWWWLAVSTAALASLASGGCIGSWRSWGRRRAGSPTSA